MSTPVVFNAVNYSIPAFGDVGYAQGPGNLSAYLIALASGTLQPTGGLFSLTADANFGPNFGLVALYYKTTTANIATAGQFRLAKTDVIDWRNNANTLNLPLGINGSDQLTFNGVVISTVTTNGTVGAGLQFQIPYYAVSGNALSAATNINYNAAGNFELLTGHSVVFDGATSGAVSMKAPAIVTTPFTFTLPAIPGSSGQFLQTDGAGTTTWVSATTTAAFREDYIVGTPLNNYTGSTTVFNLVASYSVAGKSLIVTVDGDVQTLGASADYLETNSTTVTFNNALVVGERVSFIFQTANSSGGLVNSGTAQRVAYYAATGTTVSGTPTLTTDGSTTLTATVPLAMSSQKITGLAAGTVSGNALVWGQAITATSVTFSPTTSGIVGTTTNDNAAAGFVGEVIRSTASSVSLVNSVFTNITSIIVTAGDWDINGILFFIKAGSTGTGSPNAAISLFSGNTTTDHVLGDNVTAVPPLDAGTTPTASSCTIAGWRLSTASTVTVYLKGIASFSAGTPTGSGRLSARRVR